MGDVGLFQFRGKRALVCGGRGYHDTLAAGRVLSDLSPSLIIEGAAPGADRLAYHWAMSRGFAVTEYPANWNTLGPRAGPIRNARMLAEGKPDFVLAFPGGRGTEDMVSKAKAAGVPVLRVRRDGTVELEDADG